MRFIALQTRLARNPRRGLWSNRARLTITVANCANAQDVVPARRLRSRLHELIFWSEAEMRLVHQGGGPSRAKNRRRRGLIGGWEESDHEDRSRDQRP